MKVCFYLRNPDSKNTTAIYASLCYKGVRTIVYLNESVKVCEWNFKNKKPKSGKGINRNLHLSQRLNNLENNFMEIYSELSKNYLKTVLPVNTLREKIYEQIRPQKFNKENSGNISVINFMDRFIIDSENGIRLNPRQKKINFNSIKAYKSTLSHLNGLTGLRRRISKLEDINQRWIDDFKII